MGTKIPLLVLLLVLSLLALTPVLAGPDCVDSLGRAGYSIRTPSIVDRGSVSCDGGWARCIAENQPPALGEDGVWRCPSAHYVLDGAKVTWPDGVNPRSEPAACKPVG